MSHKVCGGEPKVLLELYLIQTKKYAYKIIISTAMDSNRALFRPALIDRFFKATDGYQCDLY